jgi:hypothetical protein
VYGKITIVHNAVLIIQTTATFLGVTISKAEGKAMLFYLLLLVIEMTVTLAFIVVALAGTIVLSTVVISGC